MNRIFSYILVFLLGFIFLYLMMLFTKVISRFIDKQLLKKKKGNDKTCPKDNIQSDGKVEKEKSNGENVLKNFQNDDFK